MFFKKNYKSILYLKNVKRKKKKMNKGKIIIIIFFQSVNIEMEIISKIFFVQNKNYQEIKF